MYSQVDKFPSAPVCLCVVGGWRVPHTSIASLLWIREHPVLTWIYKWTPQTEREKFSRQGKTPVCLLSVPCDSAELLPHGLDTLHTRKQEKHRGTEWQQVVMTVTSSLFHLIWVLVAHQSYVKLKNVMQSGIKKTGHDYSVWLFHYIVSFLCKKIKIIASIPILSILLYLILGASIKVAMTINWFINHLSLTLLIISQ